MLEVAFTARETLTLVPKLQLSLFHEKIECRLSLSDFSNVTSTPI